MRNGVPHPCRLDSCSTKTACDFGTVCDAPFCDDPQGCLGGGIADPCPAAVCLQGGCAAAAAGTEIVGKGLRLRDGGSTVKLTAKGTFAGDPSVDPARTGMVFELHAADGTVLHASAIAAEDFSTVVVGRHDRFVAPRAGADPMLTWVIRLGASCARRLDMPCDQKTALASCR